MSETISSSVRAEPGSAFDTPVPNAIEQAEPGGVTWTRRNASPRAMSASIRQPRPA
jgi:hypothetical protein